MSLIPAIGGGGDEMITELSGVNAISVAAGVNIVIPTSKKAKGVAFRMVQGSSQLLYASIDEVGDNKLYRYDTKAYSGQTVTYNDNDITISTLALSAGYTIYPIIFY